MWTCDHQGYWGKATWQGAGWYNIIYVPVDIQEWVQSHTLQGWVRNIAADLTTTEAGDLWRLIHTHLEAKLGEWVDWELSLMAMSPCCKTFSRSRAHSSPHCKINKIHNQQITSGYEQQIEDERRAHIGAHTSAVRPQGRTLCAKLMNIPPWYSRT